MKKHASVGLVFALLVLYVVSATDVVAGDAQDDTMTAVMRLDTSFITKDVRELREQVESLKAIIAGLEQAVIRIDTNVNKHGETIARTLNRMNPPKWQYKILRSKSEAKLNELGENGWELVSEFNGDLVFRKPLGKPTKK